MIEIYDLGFKPYEEVWHLQKHWVELRAQTRISDRLILTEHPAVYTAGRKVNVQALPTLDAPLFAVERGGEVTFHEPGQLVAYPIFFLENSRRDLHAFLNGLEQVIIDTLADFGLYASRDSRNTGVWVKGRKIASIGIAARHWVTYHGFALNVHNSLALAQPIKPCGFEPEIMTSFAQEMPVPPSLNALKRRLKHHFIIWWTA